MQRVSSWTIFQQFIRSTFLPGEGVCMRLFESDDKDLVQQVNEQANPPFTRMVEALDLTP